MLRGGETPRDHRGQRRAGVDKRRLYSLRDGNGRNGQMDVLRRGDVTRSHPHGKGERMNAHASIYFQGTHRPLHVEGETLESCVADLMRKTRCREMRGKIREVFRDFARQRNAGIGIVSANHDGQGFGVRLALHRRDPWLDKMTVKFPPHPEIDYIDIIAKVERGTE